MSHGVGIIGAGLIGNKRALALTELGGQCVAVFDKSPQRAGELASRFGAHVEIEAEALIARKDIDAIIVCTSNDVIPVYAKQAIQAGKHVLIEKPGGRNPDEIRDLMKVAGAGQSILKVGFNHRFHPALQKARELLENGAIGSLMYFRARYGHGGRVGYDREWRAIPEISGGGELLDQGIHLLDLCRWLGGEFQLEFGSAKTFFWDMAVEDNGFLLLKSPDGTRSAFLHASCTEWKNTFEFEAFGRTGKIQILGLGGSYGTEEIRVYKRPPEGGVPILETSSFPGPDLSWQDEWKAFEAEISGKHTHLGDIKDALAALEIVYQTYGAQRAALK